MSPLDFGIAQWGDVIAQYLALIALCSLRLGVLLIVFPPTSDQVLQGSVRTAATLIWGAFVAYGQQAELPQLHGAFLVAVLGKEALIGLVLGYGASLVFWAAEGAGTYIDDLTGYNNVQMTNPSSGQQTSITSTLLSQFAIAAFWVLGGMGVLLGAVYESYRWWPLANVTPVPSAILESFVVSRTDTLMQMIAKLAAPVMLALLLIDVGFGLAAKVSQKLDVTTLGRPVKALVTLLMLALFAGVFVDQVRGQLSLADFAAQVKALGTGAR
jgi:type III secretion protein T